MHCEQVFAIRICVASTVSFRRNWAIHAKTADHELASRLDADLTHWTPVTPGLHSWSFTKDRSRGMTLKRGFGAAWPRADARSFPALKFEVRRWWVLMRIESCKWVEGRGGEATLRGGSHPGVLQHFEVFRG